MRRRECSTASELRLADGFNQPVRDWHAPSVRSPWHSLTFLADRWCEVHLLRMNPSDGIPRLNPALASRCHLIHGAP